MFRAAIFDMDGLLIDSERAIMDLWLRVTTSLGRPLAESEYVPVIGRAAAESAAILTAALGQDLAERAFAEVRSILLTADPAKLFPPKRGAREVLIRLRETGVPCVAASSTVSSEIRRRLAAVHLLEFFPAVVGGDQVAKGKPDPALYLLASRSLATPPGQCLAFEDSDNGVSAAVAAGIAVVLVPDIKTPNPSSVSHSLEVLDSLNEAIPRVETWFTRAKK